MTSPLASSVVGCVAAHATSRPSVCALVAEGCKTSYGELWGRSCALAAQLASYDVSRGDRVLVCATHTRDFVSSYLAVTLLGAVVVPFEPSLPDAGASELAARVGARVAVAPRRVANLVVINPQEEIEGCVPAASQMPCELPEPTDVAELLLTTGTTGTPKVVVLTHRAIMSVERNIISATGIQDDNVSLVPSALAYLERLTKDYLAAFADQIRYVE